MDTIYGKEGVKAGFTTGQCQSDIAAAIDGLIAQGIDVIILGCTELPLLLPQVNFVGTSGVSVRLVDPTDVLARQCVAYATAAAESHRP
jgi:aspartate racemase